jgi:hypothetical protein
MPYKLSIKVFRIKRYSPFYIQVMLTNLILIVLFNGITNYNNRTKLTNLHTEKFDTGNYFTLSLPSPAIPLYFKNENAPSTASIYDNFNTCNFDRKVLNLCPNNSKTSLYNILIKIRYYHPVYLFYQVFRI